MTRDVSTFDYFVRYADEGHPVAVFRTTDYAICQWCVHRNEWIKMNGETWDAVSPISSQSAGTRQISEAEALAMLPDAVDRDDAYFEEYGSKV